MLPAERLFQSQEILVSKLAKYLHLVNVTALSIQDEDIDKLLMQTQAGKIIADEICKIEKVVRALYRDLESSALITESVKNKCMEYEKISDNLIIKIGEQSSLNSKMLSSLKGNYRLRIDKMMNTVSPELKNLHSVAFSDLSEFIDFEI